MNLTGFQVQMFRCVLNSGWVEANQLTVVVGKNEAGKTALLKALHKFNPFKPEPYSMDRDWPRGHRRERTDKQVVCTCEFGLSEEERAKLAEITNKPMTVERLRISRDYAGRLEVLFPQDVFPNSLHPNDIDEICGALPSWTAPVGEPFAKKAKELRDEVVRLAHEGHFSDLLELPKQQRQQLEQLVSPENSSTERQHEQDYVSQFTSKLTEIHGKLTAAPSIQKKAHEYVIKRIPTFVYMDEYRAFTGTAFLDQVKQRFDKKQATDEDRTLNMILELSGLKLDEEVKKGGSEDREQRQYDLDDAAKTLTREIADRWKQRKYVVQFRADGHQFFTLIEDELHSDLIKLEERSRGFQWFFSFDLLFMYETRGTFQGCVLLLDEPGLHLHPEAQRDLLRRLEKYAEGNVLIYTTHLPFMIDLRQPERIRVLSEANQATTVTADLNEAQPEGKLTLQAALGISGSQSYLVAQKNLVVEGADDFWIVAELSGLLIRGGGPGLPDDVMVTAAGGSSEAVYIATFMIGQKLGVVALFDSDSAGRDGHDALVKKWLTRYKDARADAMCLGDAVGVTGRDFAIEDLFPDDFYVERVLRAYKKQLDVVGVTTLKLQGADMLCKRVERALNEHGIVFNKGSVAKLLRNDLARMAQFSELPASTQAHAQKLFGKLNEAIAKL